VTDIVKHHLRRVLEASLNVADDEQDRAEKLERTGHRIVSGGQVSRDRWEITDWRTGEMIAQSDGGIDEYEAALDRLDPFARR
jgi:acetate kinase